MRLIQLFFLLLLFTFQVAAQTTESIKIEARDTPLNKVLLGLKEDYGLQFAFDDDLLSQYTISLNRTFTTEEEALSFLMRKLPLQVEKSGDVFLIIPRSPGTSLEPTKIRISGQVVAARTYEPLPYSYIMVDRRPVQSDEQGHFNYIASTDSSFNLRISHLGYFVFDTIVSQSLDKQFLLMPQMERITEVTVKQNLIENSTLIGDLAGRMKINHQIAPVLPGHGDNSVFNLLRLMPGILASGEQSNQLLIWGAYESHSRLQFDGISLFGLKNFNDNIGVVNPLMVKNIEVYKGGYGALHGGQVGGIVDIQGIDGTLQKPTFTFNINSTTANTMLQLPLSKKSTITGAYRQTYYQLYDPTSIKMFANRNGDVEVQPEFKFRDVNLKYTFKGDNGSRLALSLYGGGDEFEYTGEQEVKNYLHSRYEKEENAQLGASVKYSQVWKGGGSSGLSISFSDFERQLFQQRLKEKIRNNGKKQNPGSGIEEKQKDDSENNVNEIRLEAAHNISFDRGHKLSLGIGVNNSRVKLTRYALNELEFDFNNQSPRFYFYLHDELPLGKAIQLKTGIRTTYSTELEKVFVEPRISASAKIRDKLKLNAGWGMYNQFLSETILVDTTYSYTEFWANADDESIPLLSAEHYVGGLSYNSNGFTFSTEFFHKTTEGLNQYFRGTRNIERGFYEGKAKARGVDVFIKKEYKRHMAWISYTWCNAEEIFPDSGIERWIPSPHQQKHELKFAGIVNYKQFYFSTNYVYGSGFERYDNKAFRETNLSQSYSRLDAALIYKFRPGKIKVETGVSVLNIFDRDNIKYANIGARRIDEVNVLGSYANAVPFTPSLFLKIEL